jgi:hypothetical protein
MGGRRMTIRLPVRVMLASSFLALCALAAAVTAVAAAGVSFSDPQGRATFGDGVEFSAELHTDVVIDRVELRIRFPDTLGPVIQPVAVTAGATTRVTGGWDLARDGHLVPNTPVTGEWVAWPADGGEPVSSAPVTVRYEDTRFEWRRVTGDVVRVYWTQGGNAFGQRALAIGDKAVRETAELLGVEERDRIDFFVYHDVDAFREALGPGTRENVGGQAHADIRTLFALITPREIDDPWVGIVVPHELVHIVFDTTVDNPYRFPPRWLNEGLAMYLSQGLDPSDRGQVERAAQAGDLIPLTGLTGQFPTSADGFSLAYAESVSAVSFFVDSHDRDALVALVRSYREGLTDDEAFSRAIGIDLAGFQAAWFASIGATERPPVGPQPAAPGPVPSAWLTPGSTPLPVPTVPPGSGATPMPAPVTPRPTAAPSAPGARGGDLGPVIIGGLLVLLAVGGGLVLGRTSRGR